MKRILILFFSTVLSACFFAACNISSNTTSESKDTTVENNMMQDNTMHDTTMNMDTMMNAGLMNSMNAMMDKMSSMKMSGDFDMDFAGMMLEHHTGAIAMSEQEIKSGSDSKMKDMAQKINTAQKEEINKMQEIIKNSKPAGMKMGEGELEKSMAGMKTQTGTMTMSGNADKDFAMMMIAHHEQAVSMSRMELKEGMNTQLKQMAQKTIAEQTKEINEFKTWLSANKRD